MKKQRLTLAQAVAHAQTHYGWSRRGALTAIALVLPLVLVIRLLGTALGYVPGTVAWYTRRDRARTAALADQVDAAFAETGMGEPITTQSLPPGATLEFTCETPQVVREDDRVRLHGPATCTALGPDGVTRGWVPFRMSMAAATLPEDRTVASVTGTCTVEADGILSPPTGIRVVLDT